MTLPSDFLLFFRQNCISHFFSPTPGAWVVILDALSSVCVQGLWPWDGHTRPWTSWPPHALSPFLRWVVVRACLHAHVLSHLILKYFIIYIFLVPEIELTTGAVPMSYVSSPTILECFTHLGILYVVVMGCLCMCIGICGAVGWEGKNLVTAGGTKLDVLGNPWLPRGFQSCLGHFLNYHLISLASYKVNTLLSTIQIYLERRTQWLIMDCACPYLATLPRRSPTPCRCLMLRSCTAKLVPVAAWSRALIWSSKICNLQLRSPWHGFLSCMIATHLKQVNAFYS